jgi:NADPH2:quinone reductase
LTFLIFPFFFSYGNASGPVDDFSPLLLAAKGSISLCRPRLFDYIETREEFEESANDFFSSIKSGVLKISSPKKIPLEEVKQAHTELEDRKRIGSLVLEIQ